MQLGSLGIAAILTALWVAYEPLHRAVFHRYCGGERIRIERWFIKSKKAIEVGFLFFVIETILRSWL